MDAMTNIAAKGFYYGYEHGYLEVVRTRCHLFFSELTASLTTQNTTQSIHLISAGVNLYVAIQDIGNKQFEEEISRIWVRTVRELLNGDLKDRAMQSFITSCGEEPFYRLQRGYTSRISRHMTTKSTLAEVGGQEFANSWAVIIGTIIHESFTIPGIENNLRLVVEEWMSELTPWKVRVLAECLHQAKRSKIILPPCVAERWPVVLNACEQHGLGEGLNREDFFPQEGT